MAKSNFPNGFADGVTIRGVPVLNLYGRNAYWVDSNAASNSLKGDFDRPFKLVSDALNYAKLATGDLIIVKPGHTESIIAAAGWDADTAGICLMGLGAGAKRPTMTFSTAITADIDIDAADITFYNLLFVNGIDNLTAPIDVNSTDFALVNCETRDNNSSYHCDDFIDVAATGTRLFVDGWVHRAGGGKTGAISAIKLNGVDDLVMRNFNVRGDFSQGCIYNVTDEWLRATFEDGLLDNTNATPKQCMVVDANATGTAKRVYMRVASGSTYVSSAGQMQWADCYGAGTDGYAINDPIGTSADTTTSDLTAVASDLTILTSDLTIIVSDCAVAASDLAAAQSDIVVVQSNLAVAKSDIVTIQSNLTVAKSDIVVVQSDVVVMDALIDTIKSDLIVTQSDVKVIISDLAVLVAKYASDNP